MAPQLIFYMNLVLTVESEPIVLHFVAGLFEAYEYLCNKLQFCLRLIIANWPLLM